MYDEDRLFIPLPRADCMRLLSSVRLGRVVYTDGALPAITPVNFAVDDGAIVFRTAPGSTLAVATQNAVVAFEADDIDADSHDGWSVVVTGVADGVPEPGRLAHRTRRLSPWAPGNRTHFVRIVPSTVTGRRLVRSGPIESHSGTFGP
jgi:nitroimidazol reductase NimA-like FMN-containing flavoprotein (pyridoxamine 5'-phosphate oxidase superfamily)